MQIWVGGGDIYRIWMDRENMRKLGGVLLSKILVRRKVFL